MISPKNVTPSVFRCALALECVMLHGQAGRKVYPKLSDSGRISGLVSLDTTWARGWPSAAVLSCAQMI